MLLNLIENGKNLEQIGLDYIPRSGEIISSVDPKLPVYLVLRVEYVTGYKTPNLHVKKFVNQLGAVSDVDGFRNLRGWD